ncbi:MAG: HpsJ family protein [Cyanobacteria bacterium P01_G01_bin.67]
MTKSYLSKPKRNEEPAVSHREIKLIGIDLSNSVITLRIIGYGLITLWLLDLLPVLYPLQPLEPLWGFQVFGQLVERVGVLLISLGLIFIGEEQKRWRWEFVLLKITLGITLTAAWAYFLLVPLAIGNTVRIDRLNRQQIAAEAQENIIQLKNYQSEIDASSNPSFIREFIVQAGESDGDVDLSLADSKQRANFMIKNRIKELKLESSSMIKQRRIDLIKRSLKWNIGALLSGTFLLLIWANNSWISTLNLTNSK